MRRPLTSIALSALIVLCLAALLQAYPKPSPYPVSWELKFEHSTPKRIVVTPPGSDAPRAYWYMTYMVTNLTDQEQMFLPVFELMTQDGKVIRSDNNIPDAVFDAIKLQEKKKLLEPATKIAGKILIGEDQAKEGVAIWPEPNPRMGRFSILVGGLSGESALYKKVDGEYVKVEEGEELKDVKQEDMTVLRKTLKIDCHMPGDELYPGNDKVTEVNEEYIMR